MVNKKYAIGVGSLAIVAGLVVGGFTSGFSLSHGESAAAQVNTVPGMHTNEKIETLKAEANKAGQYEQAYGCVTLDAHKQPVFCGASKEKMDTLNNQITAEVNKLELSVRKPEDLAAVAMRVRELAADPKTSVDYHGSSANPYTYATNRVEHWSDSKGFDYWVNPVNNTVVQFGPGPDSTYKFDEKGDLTVDQLQQKAEKVLAAYVADFGQVKATYKFRLLSKTGGTSYGFRWEATSASKGEDSVPFVQVVLSPSGQVMSFNDVRTLYTN